jgi:hypothetical protein
VQGLEGETIEEPVTEEEEEPEDEEWDGDSVEAELEELSQYEPPVQHINTPPSVARAALTALQTAPIVDVKAVAKKRVKMSGDFGTYRGKYTHMQDTDDLIVLMYDLQDPVYSPPASTEPFTISCGRQSHKVYFAGIEFELDFLDQGVQVFVKITE